jgi:hypothetical protein
MSASTVLLPFQPSAMSTAQLAAVSFLARYSGRTHVLYTYQLARWFAWCESNGLDPLVGIQRAHVELYIRGLGDAGLMDSSIRCRRYGPLPVMARHSPEGRARRGRPWQGWRQCWATGCSAEGAFGLRFCGSGA